MNTPKTTIPILRTYSHKQALFLTFWAADGQQCPRGVRESVFVFERFSFLKLTVSYNIISITPDHSAFSLILISKQKENG
ncbi:TPA: hypothetical protein DCW61_01625 [Candidatus Uhrbacteria bacterium]|nr:hypothetical protein [Candidatus Uhrbacteria bacterium]HLD44079.1 hypothetical protein [bacterium]